MYVCMYVMYHVVRAQSMVSQLSASTRQSVLSASASGSGRRRSVKDLLDIKAEMRRKALVQVIYIHTYTHPLPVGFSAMTILVYV
jgi:hypothetical protein